MATVQSEPSAQDQSDSFWYLHAGWAPLALAYMGLLHGKAAVVPQAEATQFSRNQPCWCCAVSHCAPLANLLVGDEPNLVRPDYVVGSKVHGHERSLDLGMHATVRERQLSHVRPRRGWP